MEIREVETVKKLLQELGEDGLVSRVDSFVAMNMGLESKKGEDFIRLTILGFLEGILVSLKAKYPNNSHVGEVYSEISEKRRELDELFRKPAMQNLGEGM